MDGARILLVEDDAAILEAVVYTLEKEGFRTVCAESVAAALPYLGSQDIDLYLLDIMLPDGTGYDICRKLKRFHNVPVIFLTACDEEANAVMGLDIGADDYIVKPFRVRELISRIRSVLRRYKKMEPAPLPVYSSGGVKVSLPDGKVYQSGRELYLSALEYKLLLYLIRNEGMVLSRAQLLSHIFDISGEYVNDNTLTVYIRRLREKLKDEQCEIIRTVRGRGYTIGESDV